MLKRIKIFYLCVEYGIMCLIMALIYIFFFSPSSSPKPLPLYVPSPPSLAVIRQPPSSSPRPLEVPAAVRPFRPVARSPTPLPLVFQHGGDTAMHVAVRSPFTPDSWDFGKNVDSLVLSWVAIVVDTLCVGFLNSTSEGTLEPEATIGPNCGE